LVPLLSFDVLSISFIALNKINAPSSFIDIT
jgi:hypothetical protein